MDINKQPGINFDKILLVESKFDRKPYIPENVRLELAAHIENIFTDEYNCTVDLKFKVIGKDDHDENCIGIFVKYIGVFSSEKDNANMELEKFIKHNAPALMFPYVREFISTITSKAGVLPIVLPPLNIHALIKDSEKEEVV